MIDLPYLVWHNPVLMAANLVLILLFFMGLGRAIIDDWIKWRKTR